MCFCRRRKTHIYVSKYNMLIVTHLWPDKMHNRQQIISNSLSMLAFDIKLELSGVIILTFPLQSALNRKNTLYFSPYSINLVEHLL